MHRIQYQNILITLIFILAILISACSASEQPKEVDQEVTNPDVTAVESGDTGLTWTKVALTDAISGKQFTIDELAKQGKPVLLHTFAVWCPACLMQIQESERMYANSPNSMTIVGIDIDPNENQDMVKRHIEKNGFKGYFAASPKELTRGLVGSFGTGFALELPQTVIVCNRTVNHIGSGLFREQTLKSALSQVCS
jgi:thiol-disulfide isomerase/thioredoxin